MIQGADRPSGRPICPSRASSLDAGVVGYGLGLSAGRFSRLYFGQLTLALSLTATEIITAWRSVTGGIDGIAVPPIVLSALELEHIAGALPAELPFGTRKIVDIGRLLCPGAGTVVLDEPFSGLDAGETLELRRVLDEMRSGGVSILIIDHVVAVVFRIADEIVVLDFGKVLMTGNPQGGGAR